MKKSIMFLAVLSLLLLASGCVSVQETVEQARISSRILYSSQAGVKDELKDIDLEYIEGALIISAKMNDSDRKWRFLVDTGAPTVISRNIARELKLDPWKSTYVADMSLFPKKVNTAKVKSINISGFEVKDLTVIVHDFNFESENDPFNVDGVIGFNILRHFIFTVDLDRKKMTLAFHNQNGCEHYKREKSSANATVIKLKTLGHARHLLFMDTKITGRPNSVKFVLDTGNTGYTIFPQGIINGMKLNDSTLETRKINGSLGHTATRHIGGGHYVKIESVRFDGKEFGPQVLFANKSISAIVGMKFLGNYRFTIDYERKRLILIPRSETEEIGNIYGAGLYITVKDEKLFVSAIVEGLPAQRQGLKVGHQITKINGKAVDKDDYSLFRELENDEKVNEYQLTILSEEGEEKEIQLTKEKMF